MKNFQGKACSWQKRSKNLMVHSWTQEFVPLLETEAQLLVKKLK